MQLGAGAVRCPLLGDLGHEHGLLVHVVGNQLVGDGGRRVGGRVTGAVGCSVSGTAAVAP